MKCLTEAPPTTATTWRFMNPRPYWPPILPRPPLGDAALAKRLAQEVIKRAQATSRGLTR